jgi:hypothetical protein
MKEALMLAAIVATHVGWQAFPDQATAFYVLRGAEGAVLFCLLAARGGLLWACVCGLGVIAEGADAVCGVLPDNNEATAAVLCDRTTDLPISLGFAWAVWMVGAALIMRKDRGHASQ